MATEIYPENPILFVDDEEKSLISLKLLLKSRKINNVVTLSDPLQVSTALAKGDFELIFLDIVMPHLSGVDLLADIKEKHPNLPAIMVTGLNDIETAVTCMKNGAFDFITKPIDADRIVSAIQKAVEFRDLKRENALLKNNFFKDDLNHPEAFSAIITQCPLMMKLFHYCESIAKTRQPLLITGETGTGKELIAQAIHDLSDRRGDFVAINVSGLDEAMFSDTLFGHRKGAFTGALSDRSGLVGKAEGGTLFLDEIGDLAPGAQVKLLRLLQEREYTRLGDDAVRHSNARVILATNRNLEERIASGNFRKDLYYRLISHRAHIPPLRQRDGDVELLLDQLTPVICGELNVKRKTLSTTVRKALKTHDYPGNIRELKALLYDAISVCDGGEVSPQDLPDTLRKSTSEPRHAATPPPLSSESANDSFSFRETTRLPTLKEATWLLIDEATRRAEGNQRQAAKLLGITQQALSKRLTRRKSGKPS